MQLPLYHRPSAIIFLDDDASYLEMLALVMPRSWHARFYTHIDEFIQLLQSEHTAWEEDAWAHRQIIQGWKSGAPLIPQILKYWQTHPERYALTRICAVDFSMPAMTGLDVLKKLPSSPLSRILLTGKADELIAIAAFNAGLIERFIPKQHPHIGQHLIDVLSAQQAKPLSLYQNIWHNVLHRKQSEILQEASVQHELSKLISKYHWTEYFVVPEPFGVVALDAYARAHWLQLELTQDLAVAADLAQASGQSPDIQDKIRLGTHMSNTELLMALQNEAVPAVVPAIPIGNGNALLGALFELTPAMKQGVGHDAFLSLLPARSVIELQ